MKLKELAAVIMSLAALVSSVTGLVTALRAKEKAGEAKAEIRRVDERLYQQAAEAVGENAERIAALEAGKDKR